MNYTSRILLLISLCIISACTEKDKLPEWMLGTFSDDYEIEYKISQEEWVQFPDTKFKILHHSVEDQYIILLNDVNNPLDGGQFTRIDYMEFNSMEPYKWGFCYTAYKANSRSEATETLAPERNMPKTGCNGFPFSRMKILER